MTEPLAGLLVIDQTQALAGPYCAMMLGDLGAEVIKIERPGAGDQSRTWGPPFIGEESAYFLAVNRNKRSITINLGSRGGQEIIHRLAKKADIFITNLPQRRSMQQFRIDFDTLQELNGGLIYAAISGYGHTGPRAGQPGYDIIAQGESGTMALTGDPDGKPYRFPTPIADMTAGLFTLIGILSALQARHMTGKGQLIDVSLLESQMTWLENYAGEYFVVGNEPERRGNSHPQVVPYEPFQGKDGEWFILGIGSDNVWKKFCDLANLAELHQDPRFYTNAERVRNRGELLILLQEKMRAHTASAWLKMLREAGIPAGPIRSVGAALHDPQIEARGFIVELEHPAAGRIKSLATPIHFSDTTISYRYPPPMLGEHSDSILAELGFSRRQINQLRSAGDL